MTYPDLRIMMFAFHMGEITRLQMNCAFALYQRKAGIIPAKLPEGHPYRG